MGLIILKQDVVTEMKANIFAQGLLVKQSDVAGVTNVQDEWWVA